MKLEQMKIKEFLDTNHAIAKRLFEGYEYPWEVLGNVNRFIGSLGTNLPGNECERVRKNIWIHKTAQIAPTTAIGGLMIIGSKVQIHNGVFLRRSVIFGRHIAVGNSYEIKNSVILDEAQVPHLNYVGDSILGYKTHMRVGVATSNVRADEGLVKIYAEDGDVETGHRKFGAIPGDHAEIDCSSVLNPGAVIGCDSDVYPPSSVRGCAPFDSIYRGQGNIVVKETRKVEIEQEAPEAPEKGKDGPEIVRQAGQHRQRDRTDGRNQQ